MSPKALINGFISGVTTSIIVGLSIVIFVYVKAHFAVKRVAGNWRFAHEKDLDPDKLVRISHRGGSTVEMQTGPHDLEPWKGRFELSIGLNALYGKGIYKYVEERWGTLELISWNEEPNHLYINGIGYNKEGVVWSFSYELVKP